MHLAEVRLNKGPCLFLLNLGTVFPTISFCLLKCPSITLPWVSKTSSSSFVFWVDAMLDYQIKLQMPILSVRSDEVLLKLTKEISKKYCRHCWTVVNNEAYITQALASEIVCPALEEKALNWVVTAAKFSTLHLRWTLASHQEWVVPYTTWRVRG